MIKKEDNVQACIVWQKLWGSVSVGYLQLSGCHSSVYWPIINSYFTILSWIRQKYFWSNLSCTTVELFKILKWLVWKIKQESEINIWNPVLLLIFKKTSTVPGVKFIGMWGNLCRNLDYPNLNRGIDLGWITGVKLHEELFAKQYNCIIYLPLFTLLWGLACNFEKNLLKCKDLWVSRQKELLITGFTVHQNWSNIAHSSALSEALIFQVSCAKSLKKCAP